MDFTGMCDDVLIEIMKRLQPEDVSHSLRVSKALTVIGRRDKTWRALHTGVVECDGIDALYSPCRKEKDFALMTDTGKTDGYIVSITCSCGMSPRCPALATIDS
jgi:hypothetical protein